MLESDGIRARAWLSVADGHLDDARSSLARAAAGCRESGQVALEAIVLHDRCRMGGTAADADRLAELADGTQGTWLAALAADAAAIAGDDAEHLVASSTTLDAIGARLLAAESASRASVAYARAGRQREATTWSRRSDELAAACEGAATPALVRAGGPVPLTAREREVAVLASSGLTSKDIAGRLYLSPRTVDNNLARIYTKLGVNDRSALADVLRV
jgi:DNA-binding CsgD family transcriptional regulator